MFVRGTSPAAGPLIEVHRRGNGAWRTAKGAPGQRPGILGSGMQVTGRSPGRIQKQPATPWMVSQPYPSKSRSISAACSYT